MWETDWSARPPSLPEQFSPTDQAGLGVAEFAAVATLFWREHCVECAVPDCYRTCALYVPRRDQKCARFRYGIYPNPAFAGLFGFGADVSFRRWAKLEAHLDPGMLSPDQMRRYQGLDRALLRGLVNPLAGASSPINPRRRLNGAYNVGRRKVLQRIARRSAASAPTPESFLLEAWSPHDEPFQLIVETAIGAEPRFRTSLTIDPGRNVHEIPFESMRTQLGVEEGRIAVFPDDDAEVRLVFTWLDFVRRRAVAPASAKRPAPQVKCVAWDLDNTLWDGILIEDGPDAVRLRPESVELVRQLDERGILQTIASKNDYEMAWPVVERLGLEDFFLYPAIHWGPKSQSIRQIASQLNIGEDTFALIDDSAFERGEVSEQLPHLRVYADTDVPKLLSLDEFDVPITQASKGRRLSYAAEAQRKHVSRGYGDNYEAFLRSCDLTAEVFFPSTDQQRGRVLELLHRSNQLNLSTYRYQQEEFDRLVDDDGYRWIATRCRDRFGDYGIVGIASLRFEQPQPVLQDFVFSCRVARKKVENAWFAWLAALLHDAGHDKLIARFVPTDRNAILRAVLEEVGFCESGAEDGAVRLELDTRVSPPLADVVVVRDESRIGVRT